MENQNISSKRSSSDSSSKSLLTEAVLFSDNISTLPPEIEAGNVEYKLKLIRPRQSRFQHLVTQLKWRLAEGQGEAIYELGVSDYGILIGMTQSELDESMRTLRRMASVLNAEVSVVRERVISGTARTISRNMRHRREIVKLLNQSRNKKRCAAARQELRRRLEACDGNDNDDVALIDVDGIDLSVLSRSSSASSLAEATSAIGESSTNSAPPDGSGELDSFVFGDDDDEDDDATARFPIDDDIVNFTHEDIQRQSLPSSRPVTETFKCAEVLIRKTGGEEEQFIEIRIAFLGSTDAGKSTLLAYLSHGESDNGHGKARLNLLRHRHEIESGKSSSISHSMIGFSSTGELLNYASTHHHLGVSTIPEMDPVAKPTKKKVPRGFRSGFISDSNAEDGIKRSQAHRSSPTQVGVGNSSSLIDSYIVENSSKIAILIDTCGMQKYIHTTLSSLTGYHPDYACVVIDGYTGSIDSTTKELLGCALVLQVPVFVVITKIDLCENSQSGRERLKNTIESLVHLLMAPGSSRLPVVVQKEDDAVVSVQPFLQWNVVPVFLVSSVTVENMELVTKFINLLPSRDKTSSPASGSFRTELEDETVEDEEFHVEEIFSVPDVGTVVGGKLLTGRLQRNIHWANYADLAEGRDISHIKPLWLGPLDSQGGTFRRVRLTSVHRQRRPAAVIKAGQTASLALEGVEREDIRKGMVLLGQLEHPKSTWEFEASMMVLSAPGTLNLPVYGKHRPSTVQRNGSTRKRKISMSVTSPELRNNLREHWGIIHVGNATQSVQILGVVVPDPGDDAVFPVASGSRVALRLRFLRARRVDSGRNEITVPRRWWSYFIDGKEAFIQRHLKVILLFEDGRRGIEYRSQVRYP